MSVSQAGRTPPTPSTPSPLKRIAIPNNLAGGQIINDTNENAQNNTVSESGTTNKRPRESEPGNSTQPANKRPNKNNVKPVARVFVPTANLPSGLRTYNAITKLLSKNKFFSHITSNTRTADGSGYVLTFGSKAVAEQFKSSHFGNALDDVEMRDTHASTQPINILIHRIPPNISEEEIKESLLEEHKINASSVYRFKRQTSDSGELIATNTVKVTVPSEFETYFKSELILFGCNRFPVSRPTPKARPNQCLRCWGYGHNAKSCTRQQICKRCAGPHKATECTSTTDKCKNCGEAHRATYTQCPKYIAALEKAKKASDKRPQNNTQSNAQIFRHPPQPAPFNNTNRQAYDAEYPVLQTENHFSSLAAYQADENLECSQGPSREPSARLFSQAAAQGPRRRNNSSATYRIGSARQNSKSNFYPPDPNSLVNHHQPIIQRQPHRSQQSRRAAQQVFMAAPEEENVSDEDENSTSQATPGGPFARELQQEINHLTDSIAHHVFNESISMPYLISALMNLINNFFQIITASMQRNPSVRPM